MFSVLYGPTLTSGYHYWKNHNFDYTDLCRKVISLLFNTLSRFVIAFLPRKKCLLILEQVFCFVLFCFNIGASVPSSKDQVSFNFMAAVIVCSDFGAQESKVCHCFHCFPTICFEVMELAAMIFIFWMLSFKPVLSLLFHLHQEAL